MLKTLLATTALATALITPALAADLIIDEPAAASYADPVVSGFYLQLLGGVVGGGTLEHIDGSSHDHDLSAGYALAGVIGYEVVDGLSVELDGMITSREIDEEDYFLSTASLMAGVRYTLDVTDDFALYAGVGIGGLWSDDEMWEDNSSGIGYQVKVGAEYDVADSLALVGELRYQAPISSLDFENYEGTSNNFGSATALVGLKLSF